MRTLSAALSWQLAWSFLAAGQEPTPRFHEDVAPILARACASCHREEGAAPFPLGSYRDAKSRARQIVEVTESGYMPPWLPEPGYGRFAHERRLSEEEVRTLRAWADGGVPEGDPTRRAPRSVVAGRFSLGTPDLVVEMPRSYVLPPEGQDVYRNFVVSVPIDRPRFVRALELDPGNRRVVHHARVLVDRSGTSRRLASEDPEPGYDGMLVDGGEYPDGVFLGWSPGKVPLEGEEALVWRLEPSTDLVLQLHMLPTGKPESVQASVALYFTEEPPRRRAAVLALGSRTIDIPAGASAHVVEDRYVLPADVEAIGIYPHAHYLCRRMEVFATDPGGTRTWLLSIPSWDFYWQDEYRYEDPVPLSEGTEITMRYVYDNSAANVRNPFDPPRRVRFGPRSSDEMGEVLLMVVPGDPDRLAGLRRDFRRHALRQEVAGLEKMLESGGGAREADLRNELAFAYLEQGRREEAIAEWRRAVSLRPAFAEAHYNLGGALAAAGRARDALGSFEKAIEADPRYAEAHNNRGVLLQSMGRLPEAVESYRRAIEIRPDYAFAHHNLGNALLARGEPVEAIARFREAIRIDPGYAEAHYALGSVLGRRGDLEAEIAHYRRALETKPDYPEALNNLGGALMALGRHEEAVAPLRRAAELRPDYALAHRNLAEALEETGALTEALPHFRIAVRLAPGDPRALAGLAWILAVHPRDELRDAVEAVRVAERARAVSETAEALDALAAAYASASRFEEAARAAGRAIELAAPELAGEIRSRLLLYRRERAFRAEIR